MSNPNNVPRLKHINSILQKVNVLDTTPQTVNGGLWRDSNAIKFFADGNIYQANISLAANILTGGIFDIDGVYFKFTGFIDGLTLDRTANMNKGYRIKLAGKIVGYLQISGDTYDFKFSDKDALGTLTVGDKISVTQVDSSGNALETPTATYTLDISGMSGLTVVNQGESPTGGNTVSPTWTYDDPIYSYTSNGKSNYAEQDQNSDSSYTYKETGEGSEQTFYVWFNNGNLGTTNLDNYVTIQETRDTNGNLTQVTAIFSKAATEKMTTPEDGAYAMFWCDDDVTTLAKLADDAKPETTPASFVQYNTTKAYTFSSPGTAEGFIENGDSICKADAVAARTFTVTGLKSGLKIFYNDDADIYELYASSDVAKDDNNQEYVPAGKKPLATIQVLDDSSKGSPVTILSMDALDFTPDTTLPSTPQEFTVKVQDDDYNTTNFQLVLGDEIPTTHSANTGDTDATFTETGTGTGTYTYTPGIVGWYFKVKDKFAVANSNKENISNSFEYVAPATDTTFSPFTISGLRSGLGNLKFVPNDGSDGSSKSLYPYILKDGNDTEIGRYRSDKAFMLNADALPENPDGTCVKFADGANEGGYKLNLMDSVTRSTVNESPVLTNWSNSTGCQYTASGKTEGYIINDGGEIVYNQAEGMQTFTLYGLYCPSGWWKALNDDGNIVRAEIIDSTAYNPNGANANGTLPVLLATILRRDDGTLTGAVILTADAAADLSAVTLTDGDANDGISFFLVRPTDTVRDFANESFTADSAGTYTYTATGSTVGYELYHGYNAAELNGKSFTLNNLRTDLGNLGFDAYGYINATNGSTIGFMSGNTVTLYDNAVHKLATPTLTGTDAVDFNLILP